MSSWKSWVVLARPSILPTVWSNCLAGWWLGGAGHGAQLPLLLASATLIYMGGALLRESLDSHSANHSALWRTSLILLVVGALSLLMSSPASVFSGLGLVICIVLAHALHRPVWAGPLFEGLCRLALYIVAATFGERGVNGWVLWCGIALACYCVGIGLFSTLKHSKAGSYVASLGLLCIPALLALLMDNEKYRESSLMIAVIFVLWGLRSLRQTFWSITPEARRTTDGLTAGIVFADWLATCPLNISGQSGAAGRQISFALLALFLLTLLLQRLVPDVPIPREIPPAAVSN